MPNPQVFTALNLFIFFTAFGYAIFIQPNLVLNQSLNLTDIKLLVMFLIAEPHFAMTIPMLWGYKELFSKYPLQFIYVPLAIIFIAGILFFLLPAIFSLVFLIANVYHVNRQSRGFLILHTRSDNNSSNLYETILHFSTFVYLCLHLTKNKYSIELGIAVLLICLSVWFCYYVFISKKQLNLFNSAVAIQGMLVFFPICLFDNLILSFAIGISIHYIQYLFITFLVCKKSFGFSLIGLILFIFTYSLLSSSALSGLITLNKLSVIIFIPTLLQLLHFYYDGFIWRRSIPLVKDNLNRAFKA